MTQKRKALSTPHQRAAWLMEHQDLWRHIESHHEEKVWARRDSEIEEVLDQMKEAGLYRKDSTYADSVISVSILIEKCAREPV